MRLGGLGLTRPSPACFEKSENPSQQCGWGDWLFLPLLTFLSNGYVFIYTIKLQNVF
jgi:hypothetical protein